MTSDILTGFLKFLGGSSRRGCDSGHHILKLLNRSLLSKSLYLHSLSLSLSLMPDESFMHSYRRKMHSTSETEISYYILPNASLAQPRKASMHPQKPLCQIAPSHYKFIHKYSPY